MTIKYPDYWRGRTIYTLDALSFIRQWVEAGRIVEFFIGVADIKALAAYVRGYSLTLKVNGIEDEELDSFLEWLRDEKEYSAEDWPAKMLADCDGDHHQAIRRFLGFVAEFIDLRQREKITGR